MIIVHGPASALLLEKSQSFMVGITSSANYMYTLLLFKVKVKALGFGSFSKVSIGDGYQHQGLTVAITCETSPFMAFKLLTSLENNLHFAEVFPVNYVGVDRR